MKMEGVGCRKGKGFNLESHLTKSPVFLRIEDGRSGLLVVMIK
jgi:hypothetical protein